MRARFLLLLALAVLAPSCRRREQVKVDTSEAVDIPREIAVGKLRDTLPTAETIRCTLPSDTFKQGEVREWSVSDEGVQMKLKGDPFGFRYAEVTRTELEKVGSGKYFNVKVFTTQQPDREHFVFTWRPEEAARRAHELIESLRQKK